MSRRFEDKVAIVTGAGRGIGRATALRLSGEGATVVVNDVDGERIADTVSSVEELGGKALAARADVTDEQEVNDLADRVLKDRGRIDILVNNAGGALPSSRWGPVTETPLPSWTGFLDLNLTSAFLCSRAVLPSMLDRRRGHLVGVGSISGTNGQLSGAGYAAAKAGVGALVASIAKDFGAKGISSNGIIVGNAPFPTRQEERQAELDAHVHLGRVGSYDEFAAAISFLCSEDSSYLSGAMIPVDGGFHRASWL